MQNTKNKTKIYHYELRDVASSFPTLEEAIIAAKSRIQEECDKFRILLGADIAACEIHISQQRAEEAITTITGTLSSVASGTAAGYPLKICVEEILHTTPTCPPRPWTMPVLLALQKMHNHEMCAEDRYFNRVDRLLGRVACTVVECLWGRLSEEAVLNEVAKCWKGDDFEYAVELVICMLDLGLLYSPDDLSQIPEALLAWAREERSLKS